MTTSGRTSPTATTGTGAGAAAMAGATRSAHAQAPAVIDRRQGLIDDKGSAPAWLSWFAKSTAVVSGRICGLCGPPARRVRNQARQGLKADGEVERVRQSVTTSTRAPSGSTDILSPAAGRGGRRRLPAPRVERSRGDQLPVGSGMLTPSFSSCSRTHWNCWYFESSIGPV